MTKRSSALIAGFVIVAGLCLMIAQAGPNYVAITKTKRAQQPPKQEPAAQEPGPQEGGDNHAGAVIVTEDEAAPAKAVASSNPYKQALEAYLKQRVKGIKGAYQMQIDFMAKEDVFWQDFWKKVQDQRHVFEVQLARQRLNFFPSLESLDPQHYDSTLTNFKKMQDEMVKSFERKQQQQTQEFYAQRDVRWKEFLVRQEKFQSEFAAGSEAYWQSQREALKGSAGPAAVKPAQPKSPARKGYFSND